AERPGACAGPLLIYLVKALPADVDAKTTHDGGVLEAARVCIAQADHGKVAITEVHVENFCLYRRSGRDEVLDAGTGGPSHPRLRTCRTIASDRLKEPVFYAGDGKSAGHIKKGRRECDTGTDAGGPVPGELAGIFGW